MNKMDFDSLYAKIKLFIKQKFEEIEVTERDSSEYKKDLTNISNDINNLVSNLDISFSNKLFEIIKEKQLDEIEVYKKANIDKKLFSRIRSNATYKPRKQNIFLLCLSMRLSFEEAEELLHCAGYTFSDSLKMDLITKYFLQNKIYDIFVYQEILYKFGELK